MKTNSQMLKDLLKIYKPETRGICTWTEMKLIGRELHLKEMDVLQLRNMRDFVVAYLSHRGKDDVVEEMQNWDRMSAITSVIDTILFNKGEEV